MAFYVLVSEKYLSKLSSGPRIKKRKEFENFGIWGPQMTLKSRIFFGWPANRDKICKVVRESEKVENSRVKRLLRQILCIERQQAAQQSEVVLG